jgi:hypothetical protein
VGRKLFRLKELTDLSYACLKISLTFRIHPFTLSYTVIAKLLASGSAKDAPIANTIATNITICMLGTKVGLWSNGNIG